MQLEQGQKLGRYSIIRELGHGGMSNVYLALDAQENQEVVLKFPHEEIMGDVATHERFSREVKIGHLLNHPNIQRLHELATLNHSEFLVLEYVPGETLRHVLRERENQRKPDDFKEAVALGLQLARALEYAHENHVAHRDLKPENVIVTPDGRAKVMDFGIASMQGARRVTWGPLSSQVGTPDYMAPEQIQGGRGDSRTDVYALGMILYEFIAGCLPYRGDNALAVMNQHVNAKPPPLHQFRKDVPAPLEEVVMKAIRRQPQGRWPTMSALIQALENPDTIDVAALKVEREAESEGTAGAGRLAGKLNLPFSKTLLGVFAALILLLALAVLAVHFIPTSPRH